MEEVSKERAAALRDRMRALGIEETDLEESFILASGKGGQKVNKTASCVQLKHRASGLSVKCARTRSRAQNRYHARQELCSKLERKLKKEARAAAQEANRKRAQTATRSKASKRRMLENKRKRAQKKALRQRPHLEGD